MRSKKKKVIIGVLALCLIAAGIFLVKTDSFGENLPPDDSGKSIIEQMQDNNKDIIEKEQRKTPLTVALYGIDSRSDETARSDVIMLIKYEPVKNRAVLVSIPRDTRVQIPKSGTDKINHAYAFGGANLLTQTLKNTFDTEIDNYLVFKFINFEDIVNKLGGVKVNAKKDYGYNGSEPVVLKGDGILTGEQALFYVRFRYDEEGDFGRIKRQQEVVQSLYNKIYSGGISNFEKVFTEIYLANLETDINMSTFLDYEKNISAGEQIEFENYTLKTSGKYIGGIYYGIINNDSLETIKLRLNQQ